MTGHSKMASPSSALETKVGFACPCTKPNKDTGRATSGAADKGADCKTQNPCGCSTKPGVADKAMYPCAQCPCTEPIPTPAKAVASALEMTPSMTTLAEVTVVAVLLMTLAIYVIRMWRARVQKEEEDREDAAPVGPDAV